MSRCFEEGQSNEATRSEQITFLVSSSSGDVTELVTGTSPSMAFNGFNPRASVSLLEALTPV